MIELAASILSADFAQLGEQVQGAVAGGATVLHLDVMDGHFVPNIAIGPAVVASIRKVCRVPLDCHLMIEQPDRFIPAFAEAGADWIAVHQEACVHLHRTIQLISSHECKPGVVINPGTPLQAIDEILPLVHHVLVMSVNPGFGGQNFIPFSLRKIERLAKIRESRGLDFRIEVDGGVHHDTVPDLVRAGAEVLVAGSAIFGEGRPRDSAKQLLELARDSREQTQGQDHPPPVERSTPNVDACLGA